MTSNDRWKFEDISKKMNSNHVFMLDIVIVEFQKKIQEMRDGRYMFPDEEDMTGTLRCILNIQNVYSLQTKHISQGILRGINTGITLSSDDCTKLGIQSNIMESPDTADEWLQEAMVKYDPDNLLNNMDLIEGFTSFNQNFKSMMHHESAAIEKYELIRLTVPNNTIVSHYLDHIAAKMDIERKMIERGEPGEKNQFEKLCNDELDVPKSIKKNLKCRYLRKQGTFTMISPSKIEDLYLSPYIILIHDLLNDEEIEYFKRFTPWFKRSEVYPRKVAKGRISMGVGFKDDLSNTTKRVVTKLKDNTGLAFSEQALLNVVNYGTGGFYSPHHDYFPSNNNGGNRLATTLTYLSDVEVGGSTVFPNLGLSVKPKKGSTIFWYNLLPTGDKDNTTLHGACPVIKGNKWILNRWIYNTGNEFTRPCDIHDIPLENITDPTLIRRFGL